MNKESIATKILINRRENLRKEIQRLTITSRRKVKTNASVLIAQNLHQIDIITAELRNKGYL